MVHISFITTIKICSGYEFLIERINLYIIIIQYFCKKYDITYEILICDNINDKNICKIKDKLVNNTNVKIYELEQNYPNPLQFNMIESYGKNLCLNKAHGEFICMTSADQILSDKLFLYIKNNLKKEIFYRFATYEIEPINIDFNNINIDDFMNKCTIENKHLCNPAMFPLVDKKLNGVELGQKSGDIMILDRSSFMKIKGWPENYCFAHVDTAVCFVAINNFNYGVPDKNICTYTFKQSHREPSNKFIIINDNNYISYEKYQMNVCLTYQNKLVSN
jgi:hypothetical protein